VIDAFLIDKLTTLLLEQRCSRDADGTVFYQPFHGRGAVRLSADEWEAQGQIYRDRTRRSGRMLRWALWLTIPFGIALMAIEWNIPTLHAASDALEAAAPQLAMILYTAAMPLSFMAWHCWKVFAAGVEIDTRLASRPRVAKVPKGAPAARKAAELLALVLLGPHVILEIAVTLNPQGFYYTPFREYRLDWLGVVSLAVFAVLAWFRVQAWLQSGAAPVAGSDTGEHTRLGTVVGRARAPNAEPHPPA